MDADADFHFVFWQFETRSAVLRRHAGGQGHAHALAEGIDLAAKGCKLVQIIAFERGSSANLLCDHCGSKTAPSCGVERVFSRQHRRR